MSARKTQNLSQVILWIILSSFALTMVIPFFWMVVTSFDDASRLQIGFPPSFWPRRPSLLAYEMVFGNIPMMRYIINSLIVSGGVIIVSVTSALAAGYALSKIPFKGRTAILLGSLATLMVPFEVTMVPQFFLFNAMNLTNTYWAFYLPAITYVFGTFFAKQYFDSIPDSFRESAMIDGANDIYICARIYIPLCGALVATLVVLQFLASWNDFLWPMIILNSAERFTVQVGVALFTWDRGMNQMPSIRMASTVIVIIPVLIMYLFLQRYIVESIALSGVKQ